MTYQEQLDKLLESYLHRYEKNEESIEFIISTACNQQCEYCYLYRYGDKTYPPEANNKDNILRNFPILLEYLQEEGYQWRIFDIFSGEFFQLSYWEEILKIIGEFCKKYNRENQEISIPTNASFLMNDYETERVNYWIERLEKEYKVNLFLSLSVDGPEQLEATERELKNGSKKSDDFYHKLFTFMKRHYCSTHPMITKNFVANYKENYDWWIDNIVKYDVMFTKPNGDLVYAIPMMLEVRDEDQWDDESLQNYEKFLWYVAEKDFEVLHEKDVKEFAWHMFDDFNLNNLSKAKYVHTQPYILALPSLQTKIPCSIQNGPVFRVGDLAHVPCHRTCYPTNIYGHFVLNDEKTKIIGIKGKNPTLGLKIKTLNPNRSMLPCAYCDLNSFCLKGCPGANYEQSKELFIVTDNVCKMFKVKYKTINEIAKHYGVYDYIQNSLEFPSSRKEFLRYAKQCIERTI